MKNNLLSTTDYFQVAPGVWGKKIVFVNIYMVSVDADNWVLIDAGLKGSAYGIINMATALFGKNNPPKAIILTHGHFDHVGALKDLLEHWTEVKVYAHLLEMPYLTGISSYPPPDPMVGGGLMSLLSFVYPKNPIDLGKRVQPLQTYEQLPYLNNWSYVHTPGHSPGHISLFREQDRLLIAGDAFVTTKQESAFSVMTQKKELSGPPKYFTTDWDAAALSVIKLKKLNPSIAATGHGKVMSGQELKQSLSKLASNFERLAVPRYGRYVNEPALNDMDGVKYVPPKVINPILVASTTFILASLITFGIIKKLKN